MTPAQRIEQAAEELAWECCPEGPGGEQLNSASVTYNPDWHAVKNMFQAGATFGMSLADGDVKDVCELFEATLIEIQRYLDIATYNRPLQSIHNTTKQAREALDKWKKKRGV